MVDGDEDDNNMVDGDDDENKRGVGMPPYDPRAQRKREKGPI